MKSALSTALALFASAGCAAMPSDRDSVAAAVGTPFYVALKIPTCVGTVAVAAPLIGIGQLAKPGYDAQARGIVPSTDDDLRRTLRDGLTANCGTPYTVTP